MASIQRQVKPSLGAPEKSIGDLFRLDGRTVIISGGGGSVGLEVARSVLESGGDVVCLDSQAEPLPEPWDKVLQVAEQNDTKAWYHRCDVSSEEDLRRAFKQALSLTRFPLQGLVTCAGISGKGPATEWPIDSLKRIMDINFTGTFMCAQEAAREFQRKGVPGSMVLIASMSAHGSNKGVDTAAYNSSKSAVVQLARSLAAEWGSSKDYPLIRVNTVSPGYIRTRMTSPTMHAEGLEQQWSEDNMMMRVSSADEHRGAIIFLLSDASSFVTGSDLRTDGGHTAW
ncbi:short chain dehydrogenase reductase family [Diplodia corticola]|uniref:Short chain dehydrogenase reductase family n=1 Tax=Diplodia corticola TaxID=236234 RepID=A0A1J9RNW1_9PEZI|nr:short chain dehydrogenase reductase family [Diplodia corticola]OJD29612.1 short chain dehydrogenase reductase family [Diplodia corticola]